MKRDPLPAKVLATRLIPNVSADMAKQLNLKPEHKSLALLTADCDDVTYTALDEATTYPIKKYFSCNKQGGIRTTQTL